MKKTVMTCVVLASVAACGGAFAQRYVNTADEAAKKARESLADRHDHASSNIKWLDNVIDVVNMDKPKAKDASGDNKSEAEDRGK
jgi:hypothetical protein